MKKQQHGFTLIEVIVVAAIIAILAGVLVPLIFKEIDEARISRASADIRSISMAIMVMKKDTGKWPNLDGSCNPAATFLYGEGNLPNNLAGAGYNMNSLMYLDDSLSADANNCYSPQWKGAYLAHVSKDPWGNAYVINADNFSTNGPVWIMSAGPNGAFETATNALVIDSANSDDVGLRIQ